MQIIKKISEPEIAPSVLIKLPQELIHIKHKINPLQYSYWIILLKEFRKKYEVNILPDDNGFYSIEMDEIKNLLGYIPKKSDIWNDLLALKNETLAFNILSKDKQKEQYGAGYISEWKISNSYIKFRIPSFLENAMKGLDDEKAIFGVIIWDIFNHFSGKYEKILYKLCKDYVNSPGRRTPTMNLDVFREYMGIKKNEYTEFKEFNRRVISEPIKKINESEMSDIFVEMEPQKEGRKVTGLYFKVEHKKQTALPIFDTDEDDTFKFAKVPIDIKLQEKYLSIRPKEEIILCIQRANEYGEELDKLGKNKGYGGLYTTAVKEGWHTAIQERERKKEETKKKKKAIDEENRKKLEAEKEVENKALTEKVENKNIWNKFLLLSDDEQKTIATEALKENDFINQNYINKGYSGVMVQHTICLFLKRNKEFNSLIN
jgi:Initiator Replication protein